MASPQSGYHSIDGVQDPRDPVGKQRITALVSVDLIDHLYRRAPRKAWGLETAAAVLKKPERIVNGTRREDDTEGWCYSARVAKVRTGPEPDAFIDLPSATVLAVYLRSFRWDVYEWRIEDADAADPALPASPAIRFRRIVWPIQKTL